MASLRQTFLDSGMLRGSTSSYMAGAQAKGAIGGAAADSDEEEEEEEAAVPGEQVQGSFFDVKLASKFCKFVFASYISESSRHCL